MEKKKRKNKFIHFVKLEHTNQAAKIVPSIEEYWLSVDEVKSLRHKQLNNRNSYFVNEIEVDEKTFAIIIDELN